ncbi:phosphatase PAP2 family protein [Bradyrhizobium ontarionense]|uniref:Phosphatase PAP2 family protein n=1 Tax=Bradyrhizobium ontarionense TaxID=2898149 RepID=A0ABY3RG06_9BRAD|nr:phosphatase PAP2 family protein [Bradyrhizobium sp. A19]UFZ06361.1 phosphatase PAP2 family protein [Bradyrhizobium sp. A19]
MNKSLTFPPYGRMVAEFEERVGQGEPPTDWNADDNWPLWRDKMLEIITTLLWPVYDFSTLSWQGPATTRMLGLTEADFELFTGLRPYNRQDVPGLAKPRQHFELFQMEDHAEDKLDHDAGVDRGVDLTLRYYLEGHADKLTTDTLANWVESGMLRKAGGLPVQLKQFLQRPRAYQMSDSMGKSWFTYHQALQSVSPSMISGHCFKGCTLGMAAVYHATALGCEPRVFDALTRLCVDFGDRRVFAGVHYPSDNLSSWITAMLIAKHVCAADSGRLGRKFLWNAISTKSVVHAAIGNAIALGQAPDHAPAFELLNQLGANPDMDIDDALAFAKSIAKPRSEPLSPANAAE